MLAFIDESGHPNPKDQNNRPVVVAVCFDERDARTISRRIYAMKQATLGEEHAQSELKARDLINRPNYRRRPEARALADEFFTALRNLPTTVFATVMQGPFVQQERDDRLENRFRFLIQRIELLAAEQDAVANVMFDGHSGQLSGLSERFSGYLFRSQEGIANAHIADTPSFVDSSSSVGIQIADMCAYVVRVYQQNELHRTSPSQGDEYLFAIRRWYQTIQDSTKDFTTSDGELRRGIYFMAQGDN